MQNPHEDDELPKHCDVKNCWMYWSTESGSRFTNMSGMKSAPELILQCIANLKANGGK